MLLEQLGMQVDDVAWLGVKGDHIDTTSKCLQVGVGSGLLSKGVHHVEGILVGVEIK